MNPSISRALITIQRHLRDATSNLLDLTYGVPDSDPSLDREYVCFLIESAFTQLLLVLEHSGLTETYRTTKVLFELAQKEGLDKSRMGYEEPYLVWRAKIEMIVDALAEIHGLSATADAEFRDLKAIIERAIYVICDNTLYFAPPRNEKDVQLRVDAVLRCVYSDVRREPALTKPIKTFKPDTGIPSI